VKLIRNGFLHKWSGQKRLSQADVKQVMDLTTTYLSLPLVPNSQSTSDSSLVKLIGASEPVADGVIILHHPGKDDSVMDQLYDAISMSGVDTNKLRFYRVSCDLEQHPYCHSEVISVACLKNNDPFLIRYDVKREPKNSLQHSLQKCLEHL
jgi:hypothetical protein